MMCGEEHRLLSYNRMTVKSSKSTNTCYKNEQDETPKSSKNFSPIQTTVIEKNLLQKIKEYAKENQIDQFNHKHVNKFLKTSRIWSKQSFRTRKMRLIRFCNNQQIALEQNKSTKPHPSSLQEFDLSSHAFILA